MSPPIDRRRTALQRRELSSPMHHLLALGFLDGSRTVFDYGCGQGDDVRLLRAMGVDAAGWDPAFRPDDPRIPADIVNLGFVLNVIEDADERRGALQAAFALARQALVVSVMLGYQSKRAQFAGYRDGIITQRNTFQKYFAQDEFRAYVESTLGANAIPVAPGVCLVFRDPADEQLFLFARQQVRRDWRLLGRESGDAAVSRVIEDNRAHIDTYWLRALELGRPPAADECPAAQALAATLGSRRRVHHWVSRLYEAEQLEAAAVGRMEDLLVYFALGHFARRRPYGELPGRLQRDVAHFFGSITKARDAGKRALFAAGDAKRVAEAALFCHDELGIGRLAETHHLTFHQSVLGECLPLVRVYVGCALQLFGDSTFVDLIKVHLHSRKVTFLVYDDLESPSPSIVERIKVDLARLRVDYFDHVASGERQTLEGTSADYYQRP
ncbi:MAG: DNA phosphorothioation-associated putative methyltransferase [Gammaproteobacteria bacterium]|nr:DNA phosphorothioation-associated putative methyltransferase [Gammaproteobacteria bacterium]